jgi:hypothetical protein
MEFDDRTGVRHLRTPEVHSRLARRPVIVLAVAADATVAAAV